jgi:PAS domain S-box-containing protein
MAYGEEKKHVLVIHNYGCDDTLGEEIPKGLRAFVDYMIVTRECLKIDNFSDELYMEKLYELYKEKYKKGHIDAVITGDRESFYFIKKYGRGIFKDAPIVVNAHIANRQQVENIIKEDEKFYGVYTNINIQSNMELATNMIPYNTNLVFVLGKNSQGDYYKNQLKKLKKEYYERGKRFVIIEEESFESTLEKMKKIENPIYFLLTSELNKNGKRLKVVDLIDEMNKELNKPLFTISKEAVKRGAIGGHVMSSKDKGLFMENLLKDILNKDSHIKRSIIYDKKSYIFNYELLKKYNISLNKVPSGSSYINMVPTYYRVSKSVVGICITGIIIMLAIIIYYLLISVKKGHRVEEELKDKIKFMEVLIETIPSPVYYKNLKGTYLGCNRAFANFMNLKKEDIIGKNIEDIIDNDYTRACKETDIQLLKMGRTISYESNMKKKDGFMGHGIFYKATFSDNNDQIAGILGVILDITNRKEMEVVLKESEERYRTLVNSIPYSLVAINNGVIEFANDKAVKALNANEKYKLIGKKFYEFMDEEDVQKTKERFEYVLKNKRIAPMQERRYKKIGGGYAEIEVTTIPYFENGTTKILTIGNDISERKKNEKLTKQIREAEEQDKIRTEFFANLSHELRTPLNVILGSIQLIESDKKGNSSSLYNRVKRIKVLKQNCHRLLRLVNNLIDITKMDAGYFHLDFNNYNIINIIEDITLSVVEYVEQKGLNIVFDTDVEEKIVSCDPDALERIMLNLISNSIKFSNSGSTININMEDHREYILIIVEDDGIGIEDTKLKEIFKRFRQVDKSFRRRHEGSGIGLSLVKYLIEMHKGTIDVQSVYEKGTKFIIKLPVAESQRVDEIENHMPEGMIENRVERVNVEFSDIYN